MPRPMQPRRNPEPRRMYPDPPHVQTEPVMQRWPAQQSMDFSSQQYLLQALNYQNEQLSLIAERLQQLLSLLSKAE